MPLMELDQPQVDRGHEVPLSREQRARLLTVARQAVESATRWDDPDVPRTDDPRLSLKQGAFVTLHGREHRLRGCIGYVESHLSLLETISMAAHAAACRDPRFQPVRADELAEIEIEISVLSPLCVMKSPADIQIGKHGLVVTDGIRRGLLLPQVASRQGWDAETFLAETCSKAVLPRDRWKDEGVRVELFTAEIFSAAAPQTR